MKVSRASFCFYKMMIGARQLEFFLEINNLRKSQMNRIFLFVKEGGNNSTRTSFLSLI